MVNDFFCFLCSHLPVSFHPPPNKPSDEYHSPIKRQEHEAGGCIHKRDGEDVSSMMASAREARGGENRRAV